MAASPSASILVGPVPFKDVVGDDDNGAAPPDEYGHIVSALPTTTLGLRQWRATRTRPPAPGTRSAA